MIIIMCRTAEAGSTVITTRPFLSRARGRSAFKIKHYYYNSQLKSLIVSHLVIIKKFLLNIYF